MRANTWYSPSKGKALRLSITYGVLTLVGMYLTFSQTLPVCGGCTWFMFFIALAYFFTWLFRREADQRIVTAAQQQRYFEPDPDAYGAPAQKTTPGSSRISLDFTKSPPPERV